MAICLIVIKQLDRDYYKSTKVIRKRIEELTPIIKQNNDREIVSHFFSIVRELNSVLNQKSFEIILWKRINIFAPNGCSNSPECPRPIEFELNNKQFCGKHKPNGATQIKAPKIKNISQFKQSILLHNALNSLRPQIFDVDYVLIEQQPSKNQMMRTIQIKLHEYFLIRGIIDREVPRIKHVYLVSPKKKLNAYQLPEEKELIRRFYETSKAQNQYRKNKDVSVKMTLHLLQKSGNTKYYNWIKDLNNSIADDLADCFLQAYCYLHFLRNS